MEEHLLPFIAWWNFSSRSMCKNRNGFYAPGSKRELVKLMRTKLTLRPSEPMVSHRQPSWEAASSSPFTVSLKGKSAAMSGVHPD